MICNRSHNAYCIWDTPHNPRTSINASHCDPKATPQSSVYLSLFQWCHVTGPKPSRVAGYDHVLVINVAEAWDLVIGHDFTAKVQRSILPLFRRCTPHGGNASRVILEPTIPTLTLSRSGSKIAFLPLWQGLATCQLEIALSAEETSMNINFGCEKLQEKFEFTEERQKHWRRTCCCMSHGSVFSVTSADNQARLKPCYA